MENSLLYQRKGLRIGYFSLEKQVICANLILLKCAFKRSATHHIYSFAVVNVEREARKDVTPKSLNVSRFIWERKAF